MSLSFKAVIEFLKKETVLAVSGLLAFLSCFLVRPDREYLNYFSSNMGTIIVLFCLMAVVAGLSGLECSGMWENGFWRGFNQSGASYFCWFFCAFLEACLSPTTWLLLPLSLCL